jgi:molybdate transport system regulatory protein
VPDAKVDGGGCEPHPARGTSAATKLLTLAETSARNQFSGTVSTYKKGAVNDEVEITLPGGSRIVAVVTRASGDALGLREGASAFALIKASSIILATDLGGARLSARNQFEGKVAALTPGVVNTEVVVDIGSGLTMTAVVTKGSAQALGLAVGVPVTALFKASSVVLGTMT